MPKFLESLLSHGHLTGWDPGWYDGFPLYTFYFTVPDLFIAVGGWVIPYDIAFKLGTILGSVTLPDLRLGMRSVLPAAAADPRHLGGRHAALPVRPHVHHLRRHLFSTLAGEYAYSFSLSIALLFLGLFACAVREGRYRGWAAVVLAVCVLSHIVGGIYALAGAAILTVVELLPARWGIGDGHFASESGRPRRCPGAHAVVGRSTVAHRAAAHRLLARSLRARARLHDSMGYTNVEGWAQYFHEADTWAVVLAGLGASRRSSCGAASASP